jgi:predicted DNA-binding transcriptional regulator YafY
MPQNKFALARYYMIDNLLNKHEYVKTAYIVEICQRKLNCNITQRTIQKDIDAMRNDSFLGYFAPIEYCRRRKAYYYREVDFRLFPHSFSNKEISLMQNLLVLMQNSILDDDYELLEGIVAKIKMFNC